MLKGLKRTLSFALAFIFAFGAMPAITAVIAFGADQPISSISISPESISLYVGDEEQLRASGAYVDATGKPHALDISDKVIWATSDSEVLTVSSSGVIKAAFLAENTTSKKVEVTATFKPDKNSSESLSATCFVTVKRAPVAVSSVKWAFKNAEGEIINSLVEGTEHSFAGQYQITPSNATDKRVEVTCEPELALEIDNVKQTFKVNDKIDDGVVRVTIKTKDGSNLSNTMTLKVYSKKEVEVKGVTWTWTGWDTSGITLLRYYDKDGSKYIPAKYPYEEEVNGQIVRKFKLNPEYAIDANAVDIEFKSSDKRVAYFDTDKKLLVPRGNGYTEITIIVTNAKGDEFKDTMGVVVTGAPYTPVTEIEMTSKDEDGKFTFVKSYKMNYTDDVQFGYNLISDKRDAADVAPTLVDKKGNLADGCSYKWYSTNESVIKVDEKTGKATCKGEGSAQIVLLVEDNGETFEARCDISGSITWWQAIIRAILSFFAKIF